MMSRKKQGFTFIEILVAVGIVAVLSAAALATFTNAQNKSRDARRQADLEAVRSGLELYRADNISTGYPTRSEATAQARYDALSTPLTSYINPLPQDPREGASYYYMYSDGGSTYTLCAYNFEATYGGAQCPSGYTIAGTNCCLSPP